MIRLQAMRLFVGVLGLTLAACSGNVLSELRDAARPPEPPPPTLDLDAIPVLGEDPAPPVPLNATDRRFPIVPATGRAHETGKRLYETFCASCHGMDGEGEGPQPWAPGAAPPHNSDGHTWHHPDQQNFLTVWQGRNMAGSMPGFHQQLMPDEIIAILAYIKTWWTPDQLAHQMQQTSRIAGQ